MSPEELVEAENMAEDAASADDVYAVAGGPSVTDGDLLERPSNWPPYIINPYLKFRNHWDLLIVTLILYSAVVVPFVLAFNFEEVTYNGM